MRGARSATRQSLCKKARFVFCRDCPQSVPRSSQSANLMTEGNAFGMREESAGRSSVRLRLPRRAFALLAMTKAAFRAPRNDCVFISLQL
ncbi:MAG: hypothetical protein LBL66_11380 [Clostridiales bacterium]|nr:hypothetical protein [Clostridiales bacterium]